MKLVAALAVAFLLTGCQLTTGPIEYKDGDRELVTGPISISEEAGESIK
jgi:hypothetical protein